MAFNIQEFQSQIGNRGYAVTDCFVVSITSPASGFSDRDLTFFARSATLPEFDLQTNDIAHAGFGSATRKPVNMQFPIVPVTFFVDGDHKILGYFHDWMKKIINWDRTGGPNGVSNGLRPFEVAYKSDYQGTVNISVLSRFNGREAYQYTLAGAYPVSVGSVTTAWDSGDIMMVPVGFTFDVLKVSGVGTPTVSGGSAGANSLLTYFSQLNTTIQAFKNLDQPGEIQSLITQSAAVLDGIF